MNGKKCKKLRKFAKEYGYEHPETDYIRKPDGSLLIHPLCVRGAYLEMKAAHQPKAV